jgi:hypothetical protein
MITASDLGVFLHCKRPIEDGERRVKAKVTTADNFR